MYGSRRVRHYLSLRVHGDVGIAGPRRPWSQGWEPRVRMFGAAGMSVGRESVAPPGTVVGAAVRPAGRGHAQDTDQVRSFIIDCQYRIQAWC